MERILLVYRGRTVHRIEKVKLMIIYKWVIFSCFKSCVWWSECDVEDHRARWSQVGISSFSCKWIFNVGSQNVQQFPESLTVVLNRSQHQKKIHGRHKIQEEYLLVCPAIICLFTHKHLPGPSYVLSIIPRLWERHSVCLPIVKKHRQAKLESLLLSPITKPKLNN